MIRYLLDQLNELAGFGRRNPREMESAGFDTHVLDEIFEEGEFSSGVVITFQVMAVSRMSARDPNSISPLSKSCQEKLRIHPTGTGHPDGSEVGRVLQTANSRQIRCAVRTPVAKEGNYFGLPISIS